MNQGETVYLFIPVDGVSHQHTNVFNYVKLVIVLSLTVRHKQVRRYTIGVQESFDSITS